MKKIHRLRARCDWDSSPRRLADGRACWDTDCMNEPASNQTLDIEGTINTYTKVLWKVGWAAALVCLGIFLWLQMESPWSDIDLNSMLLVCALLSFIIAPFVAFCEHTYTYLDFTDRQIVTVKYRFSETSKRCPCMCPALRHRGDRDAEPRCC